MKPIKALIDELLELVEVAEKNGDFHWQLFEVRDDGHLTLNSLHDKPYTYDFYMRVGTHMGQPRQAIMSCGRFIKIRKYGTKEHWKLNTLDPIHPNTCLYYVQPSPYIYGTWQGQLGGTPTVAQTTAPQYVWDPAKSFHDYTTNMQYAQANIYTQTIPNQLARWSGVQWQPNYTGCGGIMTTGTTTPCPVVVSSGNWTGLAQPTTPSTPGVLTTIGNMLGMTAKI